MNLLIKHCKICCSTAAHQSTWESFVSTEIRAWRGRDAKTGARAGFARAWTAAPPDSFATVQLDSAPVFAKSRSTTPATPRLAWTTVAAFCGRSTTTPAPAPVATPVSPFIIVSSLITFFLSWQIFIDVPINNWYYITRAITPLSYDLSLSTMINFFKWIIFFSTQFITLP